jgi:hypothetical protein
MNRSIIDICPVCGHWLEPWHTDFGGHPRCPVCRRRGCESVGPGGGPWNPAILYLRA